MRRKFIIGSRGSALALWQSEFVKGELMRRVPGLEIGIRIIKTTGDRVLDTALSKIGDKGLFTKEIEESLLSGEVDLAVHSLKDLPTVQPDGLKIGAVTARETPNDVLIAKSAGSIAELPSGAVVATGSLRRRSQLLAVRPDLTIQEIRGNVPTRIEKFASSEMDAMLLAYAGVHRLGLDEFISQVIPSSDVIPAVGQGALAIEIRTNDKDAAELIAGLEDEATRACVTAERAFLRVLEGGCQVPVAANAGLDKGRVSLDGFVGSLDGKRIIRDKADGDAADAEEIGRRLAESCIAKGACEILAEIRLAAAEGA